ncbi:hypothetical protein Cabys_362 [Caldithrix abyssi DSM 13497]|uniref:Uncharacterized protein n=1 Tax=Caldithrix abyssi DSM 13497 TaxID=880073 RepID=A0A1J1C4A8_CALAY|nr:hypothetical protein Cabys_362 [Caldithrix abyssi DSM 13497]
MGLIDGVELEHHALLTCFQKEMGRSAPSERSVCSVETTARGSAPGRHPPYPN